MARLPPASAANVGQDKDSQRRQVEAVEGYAKGRHAVVASFYDAAVSGADPVDTRPGLGDLLAYCEAHGVSVVLVENASRFARDLAVQLTGHALLRARGIELIPADAPTYFTDPSPTAEMVRQILGAVSQFEKAGLVAKLKGARDASVRLLAGVRGARPSPRPLWSRLVVSRASRPRLASDVAFARSRQRSQRWVISDRPCSPTMPVASATCWPPRSCCRFPYGFPLFREGAPTS
jgi:DNA invertase Pin-like site-specific DNA recombinase